MRLTFGVLVAAAVLAGCAAPAPVPPYELQNKFNPSDYAEYMKTGRASVTGQAFLRQQGGGTVTCAGSTVTLLPDTIHFREELGIVRMGRQVKGGLDDQAPQYRMLRRTTQCDAQGNFQFDSIPEGEYLILTNVSWTVGYQRQGGLLGRPIEVKAPGLRVLLTNDDMR